MIHIQQEEFQPCLCIIIFAYELLASSAYLASYGLPVLPTEHQQTGDQISLKMANIEGREPRYINTDLLREWLKK